MCKKTLAYPLSGTKRDGGSKESQFDEEESFTRLCVSCVHNHSTGATRNHMQLRQLDGNLQGEQHHSADK